jgi:CheY-like chemotaxis protein
MKTSSLILELQSQKKWKFSMDAQIWSYIIFTFVCALNVIELMLDPKFSFHQDWFICILPFAAILLFTLFKRYLFKFIRRQKQLFVAGSDILFSGLVLYYIYASFSSLIHRDPGKYTTMAQGIKMACVLIAMKHILYNWFFVPLLFIFQFIIYASIAVQLNIEVDVSAIVSHLGGIVILLYSGEQGIITFETNGDIIDMNTNFFSLMNISTKIHMNNVKNLKTNFQFCMDDSNKYGSFKAFIERVMLITTSIKPIHNIHLKVLCDDNDQKIYDTRLELAKVGNQKFLYMKIFDMTSDYLISTLNNNNFMMEEIPSVEILDLDKSPIKQSKPSQGKAKEKIVPKSFYGLKFFRSIIDDLIGANQVQFNPSSLMKTVQSAINSIESPDANSKFKVEFDLPDKEWDFCVTTDHKKVKQILVHLLKFAFELSLQSKLTVRISSDSVNQTFLVEIMPSDDVKNNSRLKQSYDKEYITERLGLAICNALADTICPREKHMRGVKFEPREEKGFRIYFWISHQSNEENLISIADENLYDENDDDMNDFSSSAISDNMHGVTGRLKPSDIIISIPQPTKKFFMKPPRMMLITKEESLDTPKIVQVCKCPQILVIDDFKPSLKTVVQQLRKNVALVDWVDNSNQALRMIKDRISNPCSYLCTNYKAVFLHFSLNQGKGYELFRDIRKLVLKFNSHQPTIVAYDEDSRYSNQAIDAGVDHFFLNPTTDVIMKDILQNLHLV